MLGGIFSSQGYSPSGTAKLEGWASTISHLADRKSDLLLVLTLLSTGCSCGLLGGLLLLLLILGSAQLMSIAYSLLSEGFHLRSLANGLLEDLEDLLVSDLLVGLVFGHINCCWLG